MCTTKAPPAHLWRARDPSHPRQSTCLPVRPTHTRSSVSGSTQQARRKTMNSHAPQQKTPSKTSPFITAMSPRDLAEKPDNVQSPLHRLQEEIAKDMSHGYSHPDYEEEDDKFTSQDSETASIYSFDSVSTNGRLLDRLDLESEDFTDVESSLRRRESTFLIQSTGRLLDRLGLDDSPEETAHNPFNSLHAPKDAPIRVNSSLGLERMRLANKLPSRSQSQGSRIPTKSGPHNVVQPKKNHSFDSLNAELSSGQGSSVSLQSQGSLSSSSLNVSPAFGSIRLGSSQNVKKYPVASPIQECFETSATLTKSTSTPSLNQKPFIPRSHGSSPELSLEMLRHPAHIQTKRSISSSSNGSGSSLELTLYFFSPSSKFDQSIESSTNKAIQLRLQGNPRESSYRLKLLADNPVNYPRAMYQYAKALWNGHGVKLNEAQGIRWLCRCILASYILESSNAEGNSLSNYMPKFADMTIDKMIKLIYRNISNEKNDVFTLTTKFQALPPTAITKVIQLNSSDKNTVGGAYYLLGECHSTGQGLVSKNEEMSRAFMAKSASMGYSDAMSKLGELWSAKSKAFKKDLHIAAAWLRLSETFGKKDMGNSWIYKEKYMTQKKK